jgi:hypothetical protein
VTTYHAVAPVAKELLRQLRRKRRVAARLIGVSASHLVRGRGAGQLALFEEADAGRETEKQRELAAALDAAREKFGRRSVRIGMVDEE